MQKKIMALFAMLALILTTLVMTSSATATGSVSQSGGDKDCTWEWSRTIPGVDGVKEYTFERDVPKTKTEYHFAKFTQTENANPGRHRPERGQGEVGVHR